MTATPINVKTVREILNLSQEEMAEQLRRRGATTLTARTVQRWEAGETRPATRAIRALVQLLDAAGLGPVIADIDGAHHVRLHPPLGPLPEVDGAARPNARLDPAIWLSRYWYFSSGRGDLFVSQHYGVLRHHRGKVHFESLPTDEAPGMTLNLDVDEDILTGRWDERTDPHGAYLGRRCWGGMQLYVAADRRSMYGKWVGWGSGRVINGGPWTLTWVTSDLSDQSLAEYSRFLPDEPVSAQPD